MLTVTPELDSPSLADERRLNLRKRVGLLQLVNLGTENGGLMLDLSEGGLAMQAVYPVAPQAEIPINFLLPNTDIRIDAKAHVAWGAHSKQVGLRFTEMPQGAAQQIRDWLNSTPQFEDVFAQPFADSLQIHSDTLPVENPGLLALQSPPEKTLRYVPDFAKPLLSQSDLSTAELDSLPIVLPVEDALLGELIEKTLRYIPPFARRKSLRPKEAAAAVAAAALPALLPPEEIADLPEVSPVEETMCPAPVAAFPPKSGDAAGQLQGLSKLVGRLQVAQMTESLAHVWRWPGFVNRLQSLSPAARQHLLYELDFQARALSLWLLEIEKGQSGATEAEASQPADSTAQRAIRRKGVS